MRIENGDGQRIYAKVGSDYRLWVDALTFSSELGALIESNCFLVPSNILQITTAGQKTYFLYFLNSSGQKLVCDQIGFSIGQSTYTPTLGSRQPIELGDVNLHVNFNPTGGTLLSGGSNATPINRDLGSSLPLESTFKTGTAGQTATGGTELTFLARGPKIIELPESYIIRPGNSIALGFTSPASINGLNGTFQMNFQAWMKMYKYIPRET